MGYHDVRGEGNHVPKWHNQGQSDVKSYLCLVGFVVGINSMGGGFS
jgi:hypothetical protein